MRAGWDARMEGCAREEGVDGDVAGTGVGHLAGREGPVAVREVGVGACR